MPEAIVEIARAKVNLALHVLGRRDDGYHELDSIVGFAEVGDRLTLEAAPETRLLVTGPFSAEVPATEDNLVLKAHALLRQHVDCPPVSIHLEKNLPVASGIGGGSADAAATLRGLLRLVGKSLPQNVLDQVSLQLGADVPVCLQERAVRMQGVGEKLTALEQLPARAIVLVNPLKPCATAAVFKVLNLAAGQSFRIGLDVPQPSHWRNDLTEAALAVVPEISSVLQALEGTARLTVVRMSGSGATCFGLTDDVTSAREIAQQLQHQHPEWWIVAANLR
jgi:4-diphosphocytidyl-2-C-methyl-D-erythritol kinase